MMVSGERLIGLALFGAAAWFPGVALQSAPHGDLSCTPDTSPGTRDAVVRFVEERSGPGGLFEGEDPANLTVVTRNVTCRRLEQQFEQSFDLDTEYIPTYYQLGDRFLVMIAARRTHDEGPISVADSTGNVITYVTLNVKASALLLYDSDFNEIGAFLFPG